MSIITLTTGTTASGRKTAEFTVLENYAAYFGNIKYSKFFVDNIVSISHRSDVIIIKTINERMDYVIDNPAAISVNGNTYLESEIDVLLNDLLEIAFY